MRPAGIFPILELLKTRAVNWYFGIEMPPRTVDESCGAAFFCVRIFRHGR